MIVQKMATQDLSEAKSQIKYVFCGGSWREVDVNLFSDPALTEGQKQFAASIVAMETVSRGTPLEEAVSIAEKRLYERVFGNELGWISGK
jgi:hypothetical protein